MSKRSAHGTAALVVDDSATMRRQLVQALERIGTHAVEAGDGADAWRRLQGMRVDIILTDINMPVMDGLKLIGLVRAAPTFRTTPIVVISTEGAEADRRRALDLGASDYLVKPVQSQELTAIVKRLLGVA
jgi:two-component system chemotaxis response regulator CheY